jgi:hypothetical protein
MIHRSTTGHLARGSIVLAAAMAINGLGGLGFWWAAASLAGADTVGSAQRAFVGITAVGCVTSMGLPIAVARYCRDRSAEAVELWRWSVLYSAATSVVGAALLCWIAPVSLLDPFDATLPLAGAGTLTALVVGMSLAVLVEVRLIALRQWGWVLGRAALVALVRVPFLWTEVGESPKALLLIAAGAPAASGIVGALVLVSREPVRPGWWRNPAVAVRPWIRFSNVNFLALLSTQGPMFLIPFIVALEVEGAGYSPFYVAWAATQMLFLVPHMFGQAFLVEAGRDEADLHHQLSLMLRLGVTATGGAAIVSLLIGPAVAASIGPAYTELGDLLPWLLAGCVPWAVTTTLLANARVADHSSFVVGVTATFFAATVVGALLSAGDGPSSVARAWAVANLVTMAISLGAHLMASPRPERVLQRPAIPRTLEIEPSVGQ